MTDIHTEHSDWPISEWQLEVAQGNILSGYWEWVESRIEQQADD